MARRKERRASRERRCCWRSQEYQAVESTQLESVSAASTDPKENDAEKGLPVVADNQSDGQISLDTPQETVITVEQEEKGEEELAKLKGVNISSAPLESETGSSGGGLGSSEAKKMRRVPFIGGFRRRRVRRSILSMDVLDAHHHNKLSSSTGSMSRFQSSPDHHHSPSGH